MLGRCQNANHIRLGMHEKLYDCMNWYTPLSEEDRLKELVDLIYKR